MGLSSSMSLVASILTAGYTCGQAGQAGRQAGQKGRCSILRTAAQRMTTCQRGYYCRTSRECPEKADSRPPPTRPPTHPP